ncbi:MAG: Rpp14/Pop5 family protein [Candidatus Bathyarchaeota archaeon]|nr:Rpp14/Pop5 family protein [Candidatus Bathyarchaeota archaeon]MDW8040171.1 Rpp14/Pop5 family protein [Nitrososphaerota archaeon]
MKAKTRRRYLALKIDSKEKISQKELMNAVWDAVLRLYGEYGASKTSLALIRYDAEKNLAIIRVAHTETEKIRAAVATITEIASKPAATHILTVSGTIKKLCKKLESNFKP